MKAYIGTLLFLTIISNSFANDNTQELISSREGAETYAVT
jgi:hypothetical protein